MIAQREVGDSPSSIDSALSLVVTVRAGSFSGSPRQGSRVEVSVSVELARLWPGEGDSMGVILASTCGLFGRWFWGAPPEESSSESRPIHSSNRLLSKNRLV